MVTAYLISNKNNITRKDKFNVINVLINYIINYIVIMVLNSSKVLMIKQYTYRLFSKG